MPHPQYVFSHNPDHGSLFPIAKEKTRREARFEEQKKGLIAPMKDLKIMADDLNAPTQGGRVISEAYRPAVSLTANGCS
jgi:predicted  nucleic acid-binding Zn ribbon protein